MGYMIVIATIGSCSIRLFLNLIQMTISMYPEEELFLMN